MDEAIAIAKVLQFTKDEKFSKFTRIVFDTAPTGHTLRLLSLPDFLDASIGKIVRLRQKLTSATDAVKGIFGVGEDKEDDAVEKLEQLKAQVKEVRTLFRNKDTTEFIIVTIPTVLVSESGRLLQSLREEDVPCKRLVVNQVLKVSGTIKTGRGSRRSRRARRPIVRRRRRGDGKIHRIERQGAQGGASGRELL